MDPRFSFNSGRLHYLKINQIPKVWSFNFDDGRLIVSDDKSLRSNTVVAIARGVQNGMRFTTIATKIWSMCLWVDEKIRTRLNKKKDLNAFHTHKLEQNGEIINMNQFNNNGVETRLGRFMTIINLFFCSWNIFRMLNL